MNIECHMKPTCRVAKRDSADNANVVPTRPSIQGSLDTGLWFLSACNGLREIHYSTMAHLLRGKQVGIQNDLSAGLAPDFFAIDDVGSNDIDADK